MTNIRIGTASFSDPAWKNGVIYPKGLQPKELLGYYETELGFNCVEIDASFYTIMGARAMDGMQAKVSEGFEFVFKAYKGITHDLFSPYKDTPKPTPAQVKEDLRRFILSLEPVAAAGKLGCILFQFPVFFYPSDEAYAHLKMCKDYAGEIPAVIEFRNKGWAKEDTYKFLKKEGLGFCAVDEPQVPRLMPFVNVVTAPVSYFRLHGRNKEWFKLSKDDRVNYNYSEAELKSFVPEIKKMAKGSDKVYMIYNNNYSGYAVRNAQRMMEILKIRPRAPKSQGSRGKQGELF